MQTKPACNEFVLLCNGAAAPIYSRRRRDQRPETHELRTFGPQKSVRLELSHVTDAMGSRLSAQVIDLLEIAVLVYAADQRCGRTPSLKFDYGSKWRRTLRFHFAVRCPEFWGQADVSNSLKKLLHFLSEDEYQFTFSKVVGPPHVQEYLSFGAGLTPPPRVVDQVMLMSGGLDSLAGAVEQVLGHHRRVAMVSHKPVGHVAKRQRELVTQLGKGAGRVRFPFHVPVLAQKLGWEEQDATQRSRSFLYACMGATVSHLFDLGEIWFYENGVTSVNLPLCAQELGGRATRTTHPQVLHGFGQVLSLAFEREMHAQNGFFWQTKQDVLEVISRHAQTALAAESVSCSYTRRTSNPAPHCGMCSQCLARRIAALGAEYGAEDPSDGYRKNALTDPRTRSEERTLAERFIGEAKRVSRMTAVGQFDRKYAGELSRVYPYLNMAPAVAAEKLFDLHLRHATQVGAAVAGQIADYAIEIWEGRLSATSALSYGIGTKGVAAPNEQHDAATGEHDGPSKVVRDDGVYAPGTIVWKSKEHRCDLTRQETLFLSKTLHQRETPIADLMNRKAGSVWRLPYCGDDFAQRDKISQVISRLNKKLLNANPSLPLSFHLPRGHDFVQRDDLSSEPDRQCAPADNPLTED